MLTRRARPGGTTARVVLFGALTLAVLFGALELESAAATGHAADPHKALIAQRDTKASIVAASSTRSRGTAWVASLLAAISVAALADQLVRADRRRSARRLLQHFSIHLRGPPRLHVAH